MGSSILMEKCKDYLNINVIIIFFFDNKKNLDGKIKEE